MRVEISPALHPDRGIEHSVTFDHTYVWLVRVHGWKAGVGEREADVKRDSGVESQRLVECVRQVFHILQIVIGRSAIRANNREDLLTQPGVNPWMVAELMESP